MCSCRLKPYWWQESPQIHEFGEGYKDVTVSKVDILGEVRKCKKKKKRCLVHCRFTIVGLCVVLSFIHSVCCTLRHH